MPIFGFLAAAALAAQQPVNAPVAVPAADVELMVMTEVNADSARRGDPVKLRLNRAFTLVDGTIVPEGTPAIGEVLDLKKSGMSLSRGSLAIRVLRIALPGRDIPLTGELNATGRGGKSDDAIKVLFVPVYAVFAPGNSAKFKAGEIVIAHLATAPN